MTRKFTQIASALAAALALAACSAPPHEADGNAAVPATEATPNFENELRNALAAGDSDLAAYFAEYVLSLEELCAFVEKIIPRERVRRRSTP